MGTRGSLQDWGRVEALRKEAAPSLSYTIASTASVARFPA